MQRQTSSIFQQVVLPYLARRTIGFESAYRVRHGCSGGGSGSSSRPSAAPWTGGPLVGSSEPRRRRCFSSSSRRHGRNKNQQSPFSTLEQPVEHWDPPLLDGPPWAIPPQPPPRRFSRPPAGQTSLASRHELAIPPPGPIIPPPPLIRKGSSGGQIPSVSNGDAELQDTSARLSPSLSSTPLMLPDQPPSSSSRSEEECSIPRPSTIPPQPTLPLITSSETESFTPRTVKEILKSTRRLPNRVEHEDVRHLPLRTRTAIIAMRKIVDVHKTETERGKMSAKPLGYKHTTSPPFPPIINNLLRRKEYAIVVTHILRTPELATNDEIIDNVASHLENQGSGDLAYRLRGLQDDIRRFSVDYSVVKPKLSRNIPQTPSSWFTSHRTPIPPDPERIYPSRWTDRQKLTHYFNARLTYLTETPLAAHLAKTDPLLPELPSWHRHGPGLHHLKDMICTIDRYRRQGFQPDRVTANLILRAWLQCALASPPANPYRVSPSSIDGSLRLKTKTLPRSPRLTPKQLEVIFKSVSEAMDNSLQAIDHKTEAEEGELDWIRHVQPFGEIFTVAFNALGDSRGVKTVEEWLKLAKRQLLLIAQYRSVERRIIVKDMKDKRARDSIRVTEEQHQIGSRNLQEVKVALLRALAEQRKRHM
ncbi:hypothetical protein BD324DRAFT_619953 [Kockovaella imperatae]|uniref:Uncharacterized protein n=1 Tax=Kockovaella imperatae TaxID=4999 RepID=A0A1Y1UJG2_9TREE|nr:hypothetical protein BD324DRAFT_619953 [Kockovaella imperatae]ORX38200.1 hypothetical protein BD324DRAFT_619953 [Kockovaella imperatae]